MTCSWGCRSSLLSSKISKAFEDDKDGILKKRKNTTKKRYGTEHYLQSDDYKEKNKATCNERYGTDNRNKIENELSRLLGMTD